MARKNQNTFLILRKKLSGKSNLKTNSASLKLLLQHPTQSSHQYITLEVFGDHLSVLVDEKIARYACDPKLLSVFIFPTYEV